MSFLESLYLQHVRSVERNPYGKLDPPPASLEEIRKQRLAPLPPVLPDPALTLVVGEPVTEDTKSDSGFSDGPSLMTPVEPHESALTRLDPTSAKLSQILAEDDLSGWVPDRPTLHSLRRDIASGIREMVSGFIAGCRDYVTGGGR